MTSAANCGVFDPDYAVPPGLTLADLLQEQGMSQTDLARRLGVSLKHINQVIRGSASISAELALGLEKVFGTSSAFWLSRESLYQAVLARKQERREFEKAIDWASQFPVTELKKRGLIPGDATGVDLVGQLLRFFGIARPSQWSDPAVAYRKSLKIESDPYALSAWLRLGELEAAKMEYQPYDADKFMRALEAARHLTRSDPDHWYPRLLDACAAAGVALVVVDTICGVPVNGATRWLSPSKALIQLSLRYRWEDIFWFSFFHEAGHVLLHRKKDMFLESHRRQDEEPGEERARLEEEADRFAARVLIPAKYDRVLRQLSFNEVASFAEELGIAPAIVLGRLQHEGLLPFSSGNKIRRRFRLVND